MILVCCVDEIWGMAFFGRRQSRDRLLCENLASSAGETAIWMDERSAPLFKDSGAKVLCGEDFAQLAAPGEFCFLEFSSPARVEPLAEKIILYHWNRRYQSDLKFDISLENWKLISTEEFPGSSHEKITKEVYVRE